MARLSGVYRRQFGAKRALTCMAATKVYAVVSDEPVDVVIACDCGVPHVFACFPLPMDFSRRHPWDVAPASDDLAYWRFR